MNVFFAKDRWPLFLSAMLMGLLAMTGCSSPKTDGTTPIQVGTNLVDSSSVDSLQPGDMLSIIFTGVPNPPERHDERINENGQINLPMVDAVTAAGKTRSQLAKDIEQLYVPRFFQRLTVNVQDEQRFFFVSGEVKQPGRLVYAGGMTVIKAITAAGDFTDFADRKNVMLTRKDGRKYIMNANKARKNDALDLQVVPGDVIFVPKRKI